MAISIQGLKIIIFTIKAKERHIRHLFCSSSLYRKKKNVSFCTKERTVILTPLSHTLQTGSGNTNQANTKHKLQNEVLKYKSEIISKYNL